MPTHFGVAKASGEGTRGDSKGALGPCVLSQNRQKGAISSKVLCCQDCAHAFLVWRHCYVSFHVASACCTSFWCTLSGTGSSGSPTFSPLSVWLYTRTEAWVHSAFRAPSLRPATVSLTAGADFNL